MTSAAGVASLPDSPVREPTAFAWPYVLGIALEHRRELVIAHVVAILAALLSVPIPLLMPLLVDEVLLDRPGVAVATMQDLFPEAWWGPVLYIVAVLALTVVLRVGSLMLTVWQTREFTIIAKDVIYPLPTSSRSTSSSAARSGASWWRC